METKICTKCGIEKPISEFNWRNKTQGTRRSECKICHSQYMKQQYQMKKDIVREIKLDFSCQKCGYNKSAAALDFHHLDPNEKDTTIARMTSNRYQLDTVYEEIKKCVVLCANCHREFHDLEHKTGITIEEFLDS